MKKLSNPFTALLMLSIFLMLPLKVTAQPVEITVGLLLNDSAAYDGFTLLAPTRFPTTYLINNEGHIVHTWESLDGPRMSTYLREDGILLRSAIGGAEFGMAGNGVGGRLQLLDWDGTVIWDYVYADTLYRHHHDIKPLPNGNILVIAWEKKSPDEAYAAGRDSNFVGAEVWSEHIAEVKPIFPDSAEIVWIWHAWDHLIQDYDSLQANFGPVEDHAELIDLNFSPRGDNPDWLHFNAVAYNEQLDQIVISNNRFHEIWVIDHSTTTAEAAGHTGGNSGMGGDILYRWGNPEAYRKGDSTDKKLFATHDVHWIDDGLPGQGRLILFNNGRNRLDDTTDYSSIEEFTPPVDTNGDYTRHPDSAFGPLIVDWHYEAIPKEDFYSRIVSGVDRMPNGNTVICSGINGVLFEVDSSGNTVWKYINPVIASGPLAQGETPSPGANFVFKVRRYSPDYAGLFGHDLTPQGPIETYCCVGIRGDANGDGKPANIIDLTFIVDFIFRGSNEPGLCFEASDVNGDENLGSPNILDLTYLVDFIFRGGPSPVDCQQTP